MKSSCKFFIVFVSFPMCFSFAQTDSSYLKAEDALENILQEPSSEVDNSNLYELIEQLIQNPVNINRSEIADLQQIPDLDFASTKLIVEYRKKYGNFFSVEELNAIRGLKKDLIKKIIPFVTVGKPNDVVQPEFKDVSTMEQFLSKTKLKLRSRVSNDLQTRDGFTENKFVGTKPKVYNRFMLQYDSHFQIGFLAEKDAGEVAFDEFKSFHFSIRDLEPFYRFIIGDYIAEFGQGLTLWSPYGFQKGADAIFPVKKKDRVFRPYTSATETSFLRGAASTVKVSDFLISGFISKNNFDANIDSVTGDILSTPESGFHRTQSEIRNKNAAEEKIWGARIDYHQGGFLKSGLLYFQSKFSNNFLPSSIFDLKGNEFNYTSFYYDLFIQNINIFGEIAYNGTSVASINSLQFFIGRNFSLVTSVRSYPRNYVSFHGYAFGERSGAPTNEFGIYTGIKWRTSIGLINFYYDQFRFPFATFSNPLPVSGDESLLYFVGKPINRLETRIRYKYEKKDISSIIDNKKQLVKRLRQLVRFELIYLPTKNLRLKGRYEYNDYRVSENGEHESGYLFFQDIRFSPDSKINLFARIIFFRTDSFNSAIYEYENDLTGVLSNRALFGEGVRWYLILRYKPLYFLTLSAKYSETFKPKEKSISSGINKINGNLDNRFSFQIDIKL